MKNITGRDGYIITKALAYAIAHIQSLPFEKQERSDMMDMCRILLAAEDQTIALQIYDVIRHTGSTPDLWDECDVDHQRRAEIHKLITQAATRPGETVQ